jgi:hypothetical protein
MLLAAFIFPVALMFLITGGLYTWGIKGSYESDSYNLTLQTPLSRDQESLIVMTRTELQDRMIPLPSGAAKLKSSGTSFYLEWTGADHDVQLEPTSDALVAKLTIKETSWYRQFVQLHKAKGGSLFKVYAAFLAISLFTILFSGFVMAWQIPKYRRLAAICSISGLCVFFLMVVLS